MEHKRIQKHISKQIENVQEQLTEKDKQKKQPFLQNGKNKVCISCDRHLEEHPRSLNTSVNLNALEESSISNTEKLLLRHFSNPKLGIGVSRILGQLDQPELKELYNSTFFDKQR